MDLLQGRGLSHSSALRFFGRERVASSRPLEPEHVSGFIHASPAKRAEVGSGQLATVINNSPKHEAFRQRRQLYHGFIAH